MNERIQQLLVVAATIGTIIFNGLAGTGYVNNTTPEVISDRYPTHITPAGYAFAIWSLIYLGLLAFSVYQVLPAQAVRFREIRRIYILSCVANCGWLYYWHHDMVVVCLGIILFLLGTLAFVNSKLKSTETYAEYWFAKVPFGLYFGWVTAATILNATIAFVSLNARVSETVSSVLGAGLLLIAAALGFLIRLKLRNYFYPLAIAWALTAIAVKQTGQVLIISAAAVGVIACLLAAVSFVMDQKSSANPSPQ